jgi:nitroreductase
MTANEINALIAQRRSVLPQHYTGQRVNDSIIKQMLENANWAPSHKLTTPWRFIVFTGEGLKKLGQAQAEVYKKVTMADGSFKEERYKNLLTKPMQSSHIIVVAMKRDEKKSVPEIEEVGAVFCAIQNMHLTATAYHVGAYLSTGGITYFEEAKEIFGLTNDDKLIGFFNVGMLEEQLPSVKRKPVDDKVQWIEE